MRRALGQGSVLRSGKTATGTSFVLGAAFASAAAVPSVGIAEQFQMMREIGRTTGPSQATVRIGLANFVYDMQRAVWLGRMTA